MAEATTLGTWLRRERERRGVSLSEISEQTKLSVPMLQGLEADDLSRWPGGIFRRAFARSYASAIGVDPDLVVRRIEEEHPSDDPAPMKNPAATIVAARTGRNPTAPSAGLSSTRLGPRPTLAVAAVLDLFVAVAIGLGFAAAGSRLIWPVLTIAAYHALGVLLTGRSPMLALLLDQTEQPATQSAPPAVHEEPVPALPRVDRAPAQAGNARVPTGRFRQPGRRGARARAARQA
jgi:transcriptional regulator with XRE-family HTH domain